MPVYTFLGNADPQDGTTGVYLGLDGAGQPIWVQAGQAVTLTTAQAHTISHRHVLVDGDQTVKLHSTDEFRGRLRGQAVSRSQV